MMASLLPPWALLQVQIVQLASQQQCQHAHLQALLAMLNQAERLGGAVAAAVKASLLHPVLLGLLPHLQAAGGCSIGAAEGGSSGSSSSSVAAGSDSNRAATISVAAGRSSNSSIASTAAASSSSSSSGSAVLCESGGTGAAAASAGSSSSSRRSAGLDMSMSLLLLKLLVGGEDVMFPPRPTVQTLYENSGMLESSTA
jgi:hypothetical protein